MQSGGVIRTGIDPATDVVEADAVRARVTGLHAAAGIAGLLSRTVRSSDDGARNAERLAVPGGETASGSGVDGCLVDSERVHALHDVDLAAVRPIGTWRHDC